MIKTRSIESGLYGVIVLLCGGCLGGSVGDLKQDQAESDTGSQETIDQDGVAGRASTEFDSFDRDPQPDTESTLLADPDPRAAVAQSDALDESDGSPPPWQSNGNVDQTAGDQSPTNRRGVSSGGTTQPGIRLRAAVALPQSLPTGTAMGFSVDYQFIGGTPDSRVQYVWVIKPPSGPAKESVVQLQSRGTLQMFVTEWGPVTGDYKMRIDEVTRDSRQPASRPVSATYR